MKTLTVKSSTNEYNVYIGQQIRHQLTDYLSDHYTAILIITDESVAKLYLDDILNNFANNHVYQTTIKAGEASKNIHTYHQLQTDALSYGLDRQSLIIALGGGVVGDLAGLVAATFMRGIDYVQIPTTILAHDSSVGGKVAINHDLGKNLIGRFYPPTAVIYDVETLQTLPLAEIRSGYAEIVKEALIANEALFFQLTNYQLNDISSEDLSNHLLQGIEVKANIVERDEKESGERKFLNLGHTLAHALEAEFSYRHLTHGEAVAIGLLFAMFVSERQFHIKLPYMQLTKWLIHNAYPLDLGNIPVAKIIHHMKQDKKTIRENIQMVLLEAVGKPVTEVIADEILSEYLSQFFKELNQ